MPEFKINPYSVGRPVIGAAFAGREDIIRQAENTFRSQGIPAVVIYGQRRIGKTSILLELRRRLTEEGLPVVYLDLQDQASQPFGKLLQKLAKTICRDLKAPMELAQIDFDDDGVVFQETFLPSLQTVLQYQRLALLFDEFDVLDIVQRERLPDTIAANRFFVTLRKWIQEEPTLFFCFVLGRELNNLDTDFLSTFKGALQLRISVLDRASTERLLIASGVLKFSPSGLERIYQITHGHPFFVQLFGKLAFDAVESNKTVDNVLIDTLLPEALETADNIFAWIWEGLPPAERILIAALAELLKKEGETATRDDILNALQSRRIRLIAGDLQAAPDRLTEWQILEKVEPGSYRFLVPVFWRWVSLRWPLARAQDEIDRVNPRAQRYYEVGRIEFDDGNLDQAVENLQRSLKANPDHLQARLLLGQIYLELGQIEEAVNAYEEAVRRDDTQAGAGLVQALLQRATASNDPKQALADLERVLQFSPANLEAKEQQSRYLRILGDRAFADNDFENAQQLYEKAGLTDLALKASEVLSLRQEQLKKLTQSAEQTMKEKNWASSIDTLQEILLLDPKNFYAQKRLQEAQRSLDKEIKEAERLRHEQIVLGNLQIARVALNARNYAEAIENFKKVLEDDPQNADATRLLEQAYLEQRLQSRLQKADDQLARGLFRDASKTLDEEPKPDEKNSEVVRLRASIARQKARFKRIRLFAQIIHGLFFGTVFTFPIGWWWAGQFAPSELDQQLWLALTIGLFGFTGASLAASFSGASQQKTSELFGFFAVIFSLIFLFSNSIAALIGWGIGLFIHWISPGSWWGFYVPSILWNALFILFSFAYTLSSSSD